MIYLIKINKIFSRKEAATQKKEKEQKQIF
jgi:hypothetical protein